MFRFRREKILPFFLQKRMTVAELARRAGISHLPAQRAVEGERVAAPIISKIAEALEIDPMEFLENGGDKMFSKKTVTIEREDGTKKDVEISIDDTGKLFSVWSEDEADMRKALAQYFSQKQKGN